MAAECACGHPQSKHKLGKNGCRGCDIGCARFVAEETAEPAVEPENPDPAVMDVLELQRAVEPVPADELAAAFEASADPGVSTSARLRAVEQERDGLAERVADLETRGTNQLAATVEAQRERDDARGERDQVQQQLNELSELHVKVGLDLTEMRKERDQALAKQDAAVLELADAVEALPCIWCNGIGIAPEERFGRDPDGAPMVDGPQPCPEGCEVVPWLAADRNDAADTERDLATAREALDEYSKLYASATAEIERLKASADGYLLAGTDGMALLDQADATNVPAIQATGDSIRDLIGRLREQLADHEQREDLRAELARIEQRAAQIRAELGEPDAGGWAAGPQPTDREVRAWAKANGFTVEPRGRVSDGMRAAYRKAHPA